MMERVLIAGVGNVFLSDDGFGVEVVRRLTEHELPRHVEAVDIGVRGVDLAYRLLDGYGTCILIDACARGGEPGTLYCIDARSAESGPTQAAAFDGHRMTPDAVLGLLDTLSAGTGDEPPHTVTVLGCEPACVEEGMGLSESVAASVPQAVQMILGMIETEPGQRPDQCHSHSHTTDPVQGAYTPVETGAN
jgi:hydrogenase maturation protease